MSDIEKVLRDKYNTMAKKQLVDYTVAKELESLRFCSFCGKRALHVRSAFDVPARRDAFGNIGKGLTVQVDYDKPICDSCAIYAFKSLLSILDAGEV